MPMVFIYECFLGPTPIPITHEFHLISENIMETFVSYSWDVFLRCKSEFN